MRPSFRHVLIAVFILIGIGFGARQSVQRGGDPATFVSNGELHRIVVPLGDRRLERFLEAGAVKRLEEYESFAFAIVDVAPLGGIAALEGLDIRDEEATIGFNDFILDTADAQDLASKLGSIPPEFRSGDATRSTGRDLAVVQFSGPIRDEWLTLLRETRLEIVSYMAFNSYIVAGDLEALAKLEALRESPIVQWIGDYHPWLRLSPDLREVALSAAGESAVTLQIIADEHAMELVDAIENAGIEPLRPGELVLGYYNLRVVLPNAWLRHLAAHPSIFCIENVVPVRRFDEVQGQGMAGNVNAAGSGPSGTGYLAWLQGKGFSQTGQFAFAVDVTDDGVDRGSTTDVNNEFRVGGQAAGASRVVYNNNYTSDPTGDGRAGHGNINASIIGGYNDSTGSAFEDAGGYNYGLGIAPWVQIGNSKVFDNAGGGDFNQPTSTRLSNAYSGGARISSNSWGQISGNNYTTDSQTHDARVRDAQTGVTGNQEMTIVFAAGNDGSGANTVRPPATAKNIITVAAGENNRQTGSDGCGIANTGANDFRDIISFSSRGPASDLRKKPDISAPGTHIQGAASRATGYDGTGVCNQYWPTGQTLYCWSSGTSHSTPAVSGAAALVRQYFINQGWGTPTPAMVKAVLMGTPNHMTGVGANDTLWSNNQGMGSVNIGRAFDGSSNMRVDQSQVLGATGNTYTTSGVISSSARPFRVALSWTDAPGATTGNAFVNNLDLEVTVNGTLYRGNVFSAGSSVTGGTADTRNNAEFVFLPAGTTGSFSITVRATNIAGDGIPGNGDTTDQDFALFVYNGTTAAPTPDFTLSATPGSQTVTQGQGTSYTVSVAPLNGFSGSTTLSASAPTATGVGFSFGTNPVAAGGTSVMSVTTAGATTGSHTVTITGTSGALVRTTTVTLTINPPAGGNTVRTFSVTPNAAIPDNNSTGVTSSVSVPVSQTISSVSVRVAITHTYQGDLVVTLISPAGTQRRLHNLTGAGTDNINTVYAILTAPTDALTTLNGQNTSGTWQLKVQDLAAADVGTLNSWTITFNGEQSATPNLAIPDNNTTGITSTLNYAAGGVVTGVRVKVNITHTFKGDLEVALIAPDNTTVLLHNRTGGSADNINTVFPDLTASAQSLTALNGKSIAGAWRLRVRDLAATDVGTLVSWTLCLNGQ